ncbi:MAG: tetratricopeptide repeat protein [Candidatus Omnitrophota bacterium]
MKKNILISAAAVIVFLIICAALLLKSKGLESRLEQANQMAAQMQDELKRVQAEKAKMQKDNDKLHADAVSYLALNSQLQDEKDSLQKRFSEAQRSIENKESDLQKTKKKMEELEKSVDLEKSKVQGKSSEEKAVLEKKIAFLEDSLAKERGLYHYNLGVAYAQAKLYDEAVEAYEKSISYNPDNAEAHYNLAVLYENMKDDPDGAAIQYRIYLELRPDAEDREHVEAIIDKLE